MPLGNSNGSVHSRGKNKALLVKRIIEIVAAANFTQVAGSAVQGGSDPCREAANVTYWHDGSSAMPIVGDTMYTEQRAFSPNVFEAGYLRITDGAATNLNIQVNATGKITGLSICE
jgi:hypothetical protein